MTARVLTGSKQDIARQLAGLEGDVREAIVFIEEPIRPAGSSGSATSAPLPVPANPEELFAEMEPYMAETGEFDDSRAAIYERLEGE